MSPSHPAMGFNAGFPKKTRFSRKSLPAGSVSTNPSLYAGGYYIFIPSIADAEIKAFA